MMTNGLKGEAAVVGADAVLVFDTSAFIAIEGATGMSTTQVLANLSDGLNLSLIAQVLWAGMLRRRPEAKADDAIALIDMVGIDPVTAAIGTAINQAFPSAEGKGGARRARAGSGTGAAS